MLQWILGLGRFDFSQNEFEMRLAKNRFEEGPLIEEGSFIEEGPFT